MNACWNSQTCDGQQSRETWIPRTAPFVVARNHICLFWILSRFPAKGTKLPFDSIQSTSSSRKQLNGGTVGSLDLFYVQVPFHDRRKTCVFRWVLSVVCSQTMHDLHFALLNISPEERFVYKMHRRQIHAHPRVYFVSWVNVILHIFGKECTQWAQSFWSAERALKTFLHELCVAERPGSPSSPRRVKPVRHTAHRYSAIDAHTKPKVRS